MRVRVRFSRQGRLKFIGHLDMMRCFQREIAKAGIDVSYSEGMSPHMIMSFALPLGVGMTSDSEYVDVDLNSSFSGEEMIRRLNEGAPDGIHYISAREIPVLKSEKGMVVAARADYTIRFRPGYEWDDGWKEDFARFMAQDEILTVKKTKKTERTMNLKEFIYGWSLEREFTLALAAGSENNVRPELLLDAFADATGREKSPFRFQINRDDVYADRGQDGTHEFISLGEIGTPLMEKHT